jgi:hypothetical protein
MRPILLKKPDNYDITTVDVLRELYYVVQDAAGVGRVHQTVRTIGRDPLKNERTM